MSRSATTNRREFLLLRTGCEEVLIELSCEQLLMKYLDARLDGSAAELFARLADEVRSAQELRVVDTAWLMCADLKEQLSPVLDAFRARGGRLVVE